MSDRITETRGKLGAPVVQFRGKLSRATAIKRYRQYCLQMAQEAQIGLNTPVDELEVSTYLGVHVRRERKKVSD